MPYRRTCHAGRDCGGVENNLKIMRVGSISKRRAHQRSLSPAIPLNSTTISSHLFHKREWSCSSHARNINFERIVVFSFRKRDKPCGACRNASETDLFRPNVMINHRVSITDRHKIRTSMLFWTKSITGVFVSRRMLE